MSTIKIIRHKLGMTQTEMAQGIGCTQANVGHYERGQTVPPDMARKVIDLARTKGFVLTYNDIYGDGLDETNANQWQGAIQTAAQGACNG